MSVLLSLWLWSNDITLAKKSNKVLYCKSYEDIKFLFEKITKVPN